jgi:hypothetical protein
MSEIETMETEVPEELEFSEEEPFDPGEIPDDGESVENLSQELPDETTLPTGKQLPENICAKLRALREQQRATMNYVDGLKVSLKAAKSSLEEINAKIGLAIDEIDQPGLPFSEPGLTSPAETKTEAEPTQEDAWREVPLHEALGGLSIKIFDALKQANLTTVGQLADWINADGGRNRLTDLAGIGKAKGEKIEEAMEKFWERRKDLIPKEEPPEESDVAGK